MASTFHAAVAGNNVATAHDGLLHAGTALPWYNATAGPPLAGAARTVSAGCGSNRRTSAAPTDAAIAAAAAADEDDDGACPGVGIRMLRTEMDRTSRANHCAWWDGAAGGAGERAWARELRSAAALPLLLPLASPSMLLLRPRDVRCLLTKGRQPLTAAMWKEGAGGAGGGVILSLLALSRSIAE